MPAGSNPFFMLWIDLMTGILVKCPTTMLPSINRSHTMPVSVSLPVTVAIFWSAARAMADAIAPISAANSPARDPTSRSHLRNDDLGLRVPLVSVLNSQFSDFRVWRVDFCCSEVQTRDGLVLAYECTMLWHTCGLGPIALYAKHNALVLLNHRLECQLARSPCLGTPPHVSAPIISTHLTVGRLSFSALRRMGRENL